MKLKNKLMITSLTLAGCILFGCFSFLYSRPVEIVTIHHRSSGFSDVLVKNFPFTDRGKIHWWLKHKAMLKEKYNVPNPDKEGSFYLTFWLFGDGYKEEEKYDRLCFKDMKTHVNCIDKDAVFSVDNSINMGVIFRTYDGTYRLQKNGAIVKYVDHYEAW